MMKKQLALLLACLMLFTLTACGGESPAAPNEGTSQSSDSGQENIETPQGEEEEEEGEEENCFQSLYAAGNDSIYYIQFNRTYTTPLCTSVTFPTIKLLKYISLRVKKQILLEPISR